jgi:hypothetical protein
MRGIVRQIVCATVLLSIGLLTVGCAGDGWVYEWEGFYGSGDPLCRVPDLKPPPPSPVYVEPCPVYEPVYVPCPTPVYVPAPCPRPSVTVSQTTVTTMTAHPWSCGGW